MNWLKQRVVDGIGWAVDKIIPFSDLSLEIFDPTYEATSLDRSAKTFDSSDDSNHPETSGAEPEITDGSGVEKDESEDNEEDPQRSHESRRLDIVSGTVLLPQGLPADNVTATVHDSDRVVQEDGIPPLDHSEKVLDGVKVEEQSLRDIVIATEDEEGFTSTGSSVANSPVVEGNLLPWSVITSDQDSALVSSSCQPIGLPTSANQDRDVHPTDAAPTDRQFLVTPTPESPKACATSEPNTPTFPDRFQRDHEARISCEGPGCGKKFLLICCD